MTLLHLRFMEPKFKYIFYILYQIWRVGCNRGKENESAMSVMFKFANFSVSSTPLEIVSAFALKKFPGVIFIEANFEH